MGGTDGNLDRFERVELSMKEEMGVKAESGDEEMDRARNDLVFLQKVYEAVCPSLLVSGSCLESERSIH